MRVPALTGIRGVAAVAVMLYHIPEQAIFAPYRIAFVNRAYLCVDLFFVLSGFVIAIGYHDRVVRHFSGRHFRDFLANRFARVFPLHCVVALVFALRMAVNVSGVADYPLTATDLVANLLMIQSWGIGTHALAGNSWSVSTEVVAYILFPLIGLWAFSRQAWALVLLSMVALAIVATSGLGVEGVMDVVQPSSLLPVVRCLAGFSLGVFAYAATDVPWVQRVFGSAPAFAIVTAATLLAFLVPGGDLVVVLLCPFLVLTCYYDARFVRLVMANPLTFHLGLISYSLYLWHPLVRDIAARFTAVAHRHGITQYDLLIIVAMIALTWLGSWISYRLIEVPGHRVVKSLNDRWSARRAVVGPVQ